MIDTTTKKPVRVSADDYPERPFIFLPFSQLDGVRRLLDSQGIGYYVMDNVISFNGAPEQATIVLDRGTDAGAVQAILDSVR